MENKKPRSKFDAIRGTVASAGEAAANLVHKGAQVVASQDQKLGDLAARGTKAVGKTLGESAMFTGKLAEQASRALKDRAAEYGNRAATAMGGTDAHGVRARAGSAFGALTRLVTQGLSVAAKGVAYSAKALEHGGKGLEEVSEAAGGTVSGLVRGAAETTSNAVDSLALPLAVKELRAELQTVGGQMLQRAQQREVVLAGMQANRRRDVLLDSLVVGGFTLSMILKDPASIPPEIQQAFALAYPGLAETESFAQAIEGMSDEGLQGMVSAVKGKLFEIELVEHLNNGGLPDGLHAELAASATQPGWDIRIVDEQGDVVELLQAKATESLDYVQAALEKYPDIDVTTTSEVYAQLAALGTIEGVRDSGISEQVLEAKVQAAADAADGFDASDLLPGAAGLAVIGLIVFMRPGGSLRAKGEQLGDRVARATAASLVAKAALVLSQAWMVGLIAGVSAGWLANKGREQREIYEMLTETRATLKKLSLRFMPT